MLKLDAIVYTLVNLLILYAGLRHFLIKPIQSVMEQRKSMIEKQFSEAKETMDEANRQKNDYEDLLKGAKEEARQIVEQSKSRAQQEYEKTLQDAQNQSERMLKKAQKDIEVERQKSMADVQSQIAQAAMAAAGKILSENTGMDVDRAIYNQYIGKAGGAYDADRN